MKATPRTVAGIVTSNQSTLDSNVVFTSKKKYSSDDRRQSQITKALVTFISTDLLPLSLVDSTQFHSLMEAADPHFQVPSRKHLST